MHPEQAQTTDYQIHPPQYASRTHIRRETHHRVALFDSDVLDLVSEWGQKQRNAKHAPLVRNSQDELLPQRCTQSKPRRQTTKSIRRNMRHAHISGARHITESHFFV